MKNQNKLYQNLLFIGGAIIAIIFVNIQIISFNHTVNHGKTLLVPLYFPEDTDFGSDGYMTVRYENIIPDTNFNSNDGKIIVSSDVNKAVIYSRFSNLDMPAEVGEFLLSYEVRRPYAFFDNAGLVRVAFGSEKFYYRDEELIDYYTRAQYAVLKLAKDGNSVLVGLADINYQNLGRYF